MARLTPSKQKSETINLHLHIPKHFYRDVLIAAIDSEENLKDMFMRAFNEKYLNSAWKSKPVTKTRVIWEKNEEG